MFLLARFMLWILRQVAQRGCCVLRASHMEAHGVHLPILGDVNFDYLVKVLCNYSTE